MIEYDEFRLENGLRVVTHEAWDTPMATVNVLYAVGSRDEDPQLTGMAHLLEHLMFSGTEAVPDFDAVVSSLGGESNAFTNTDYTNYYLTLPAQSLPTALALEADRMGEAADLKREGVEVQKKVVTEEYRQRYKNAPYGDIWLELRPLCYGDHPYRWATIGKAEGDGLQLAAATAADVDAFRRRFYKPQNAILGIAAPVSRDEMRTMVTEAFSKVCAPQSPARTEVSRADCDIFHYGQRKEVRREVPATAVYAAWPMCDHHDPRFRGMDLLSDVLGNGRSSRLYRRLVNGGGLLTEADACISGEEGPGLFVVSGKVRPGADPEEALAALVRETTALGGAEPPTAEETAKVVNRYESQFVFSQYKAQDRAMGLCYYSWLGDTSLVNREPEEYRRWKDNAEGLRAAAADFLKAGAENTMIYGDVKEQ